MNLHTFATTVVVELYIVYRKSVCHCATRCANRSVPHGVRLYLLYTTGVLSSCAKLLLMVQARATQVQTAYSIERHGVLFHKCFSQASSYKVATAWVTPTVHGHTARTLFWYHGVFVILYGLCVFVCVGRGDNVCV